MCTRSQVTGAALVFEPPRGQPDIVDGMEWGGWVVMVVGGEHQVPAEEEEFAGRLKEDVRGGGTVVKGDHFRGRGEGTRPGRWGTSALAPCHGIRGIAQFGCNVPRSRVSSFPVATYIHQ